MYLTEINPETGLVIISKSRDGVMAIKEFRDLINNKEYGLECFTAVALTADYLSPNRMYDDNDRPRASMEEVTGDRNKWQWKNKIIQDALVKYEDLQYDPEIEEEQILKLRKTNVLNKLKQGESMDNEKRIEANINMNNLQKTLRQINQDIAEFEKRNVKKNIHSNSPVENGYSLSRIEQKLLKRRSHYNAEEQVE